MTIRGYFVRGDDGKRGRSVNQLSGVTMHPKPLTEITAMLKRFAQNNLAAINYPQTNFLPLFPQVSSSCDLQISGELIDENFGYYYTDNLSSRVLDGKEELKKGSMKNLLLKDNKFWPLSKNGQEI